MKTIITLVFFAFSYMGFAQLIDPFGKITVHEIKLNKQKDGTYLGAMEWTTGGADSLQKFIVNNLNIKAPVMVTILSKAPDHNIDLGFYSRKWTEQDLKISTKGEKFAHAIFRTNETAGLEVSSKVANIPYLITVKVGLQFPLLESLIKITDDKEEYAKHMRSLGYQGALFGGDNPESANNESSTTGSSVSDGNNSLMYIVIGLLAVIAILFAIFIMKKNSSKTTMLLLCFFGIYQLANSQNSVPRNVPMSDMEQVFIGYQTQNVSNQVPVTYGEPGLQPAMDSEHRENNGNGIIRIQPNQSSNQLSVEEREEIQRRMNEDREQFDRDYGDGSPGEETEGDQRTLPTDRDNEELEALRSRIRRLEQQVRYLSKRDRENEERRNQQGQIVIYCETRPECASCMESAFSNFLTYHAYYTHLQNFYARKSQDLNDWIAYGNNMSSLPGGAGLGWSSIHIHKVRPSMEVLKEAYRDKFDHYITKMGDHLERMRACYTSSEEEMTSLAAFDMQAFQMLQTIKATRIDN